MNRKGDLALALLVFIVLVAIGVIIFGFLGFDSNMRKKVENFKKPIEEAGFAQQYIFAEAELIGKESIEKGGDVKSNFISLAAQKDFGVEGSGNFFRKIREGDFQFHSDNGGEIYRLQIMDLFIVSRKGSNEIERNFDINMEISAKERASFTDGANVKDTSTLESFSMGVGQKVPFIVGNAEQHSVTLLSITEGHADFLLESNPKRFTLGVGESRDFYFGSRGIQLKLISVNSEEVVLEKQELAVLGASSHLQSTNTVYANTEFSLDGVVKVGWEDYKIVDTSNKPAPMYTYGVDGCMAALVLIPDGKTAALAHFHWNNEKTLPIIQSLLKDMSDKLDKKSYVVLIGGYEGLSDGLFSSLQKSFEENCIEVIGLPKEIMDNRIRDVLYDPSTKMLHIKVWKNKDNPSEDRTYKVIFKDADSPSCQINKENIEQIDKYFLVNDWTEEYCRDRSCTCLEPITDDNI